jgi:hypothetical protein
VHVKTAVDADRLAGHEVAVVGGEKDHRADEVGRILIAVKGAALVLRVGGAFDSIFGMMPRNVSVVKPKSGRVIRKASQHQIFWARIPGFPRK